MHTQSKVKAKYQHCMHLSSKSYVRQLFMYLSTFLNNLEIQKLISENLLPLRHAVSTEAHEKIMIGPNITQCNISMHLNIRNVLLF